MSNDVMSTQKTIEATMTETAATEAMRYRPVKLTPETLNKLTLDEKQRILVCLKELQGHLDNQVIAGPCFLTVNDQGREVYVVVSYAEDKKPNALTAVVADVVSLFEPTAPVS